MENDPDVHFGMKKLQLHNWREPDVPKCFPGLTEEVWVTEGMRPQLISAVPEEVVSLFEIARGSILYGWLFYPLLTLASEQLHRVQEAAVRARCQTAGIPITRQGKDGKTCPRNFGELIRDLSGQGIIGREERSMWEAVRKLRNWSSHPERPTILPPGHALAAIDVTARRINQIFDRSPHFHSELGLSVRKATGLHSPRRLPIVAGIDVGGEKKGFHLVALRDASIIGKLTTREPDEAVAWCRKMEAAIVGVDAPSGWCCDPGKGRRQAEDFLSIRGYASFPTPSRERALHNPANAWMLNGERLYTTLVPEYPLFRGTTPEGRFCFETYPYLASCGLAGRRLDAQFKRRDRRDIVRSAGIDDRPLKNGDFLDAAICALAAFSVAIDYATMCGNAEEGFILAPCYI